MSIIIVGIMATAIEGIVEFIERKRYEAKVYKKRMKMYQCFD